MPRGVAARHISQDGPGSSDWHGRETSRLGVVARLGRARLAELPLAPAGDAVCLDLLIDGESGIWHLANVGDVSWAELAARAATLAGVPTATLQPCTSALLSHVAARPRNGVLGSERASLMPTLDDALQRFLGDRVVLDEAQANGDESAVVRSSQRAAGG